jgi:FkbM family methyltransferase
MGLKEQVAEYNLGGLPDFVDPVTVIDAGANVGVFSLEAVKRWPGAVVLAYEPHPAASVELRYNVRNAHIIVRQAALVHPKTSEEVRLYEGLSGTSEASIRDDVRWPHISQRLDEWTMVATVDSRDLPPCDVLKIDTEGSEVPILTGYPHLSQVKVLLVEAHAVGGDLQGEIRRITEIAEAAGLHQQQSVRFDILRFVRATDAPGITITGTVKDAPSAAASSVKSVRAQTHASFRHVLFALGDETMEAATKEADGDARIDVRAPVTPGAPLLANLLPVWRSLPDDEIIVWLDGDDELTPHALERVLDAHRKGAWVTYGQFSIDGRIGFAAPVGDNPRREDWHATHLKTFRAGLVKQMRDADFREVDGTYAGTVPDARIMFGVLELAGLDRSVFIPDVLYLYNWDNAFFSKASPEELEVVSIEFARVRDFAPYARTDSLTAPPPVAKKETRARYAVEGQPRATPIAGKDMDLVQIFQKYGTDKLVNGYAPLYHTLLDGRREQVRSVLEVGIGTMIPGVHSSMVGYAGAGYSPGGSLRAWRDYFRNASVLGMDVQPDTQFSEERIQTVLCDSTDALAVQRAVGDKMFDFIVDDGSHVDVNQFSTLRNLYGRLRPGGFYVIEDIHPGNSVRDAPHLVGSIVGHNEYFFTGIRNNLCVIYAQPMTSYKREAW